MKECFIEIRRNGDQIDISVSAPTPNLSPNSLIREREMINLPSDQLEALRKGNPSQEVLRQITLSLSQWFHIGQQVGDNALNLPDLLQFRDPNQDSWRLVFSMQSIRDENLLYQLANIPMELLSFGDLGLVLENKVSSMVHLLPKTGNPAFLPNTWPLRILIVRSSPNDFTPIPEAGPIKAQILAANPALSDNNLLQVDVLSSENSQVPLNPPTKGQFREQLKQQSYDILVYLGHGNIEDAQPGQIPSGQLVLETPDQFSDAVSAKQLAGLLRGGNAPQVVLLVGCLTAAELEPDIREEFEAEFARWVQGSQGVAQALINGSSDVQFVVGMRFRIESSDAKLFLKEFFKSLLNDSDAKGNFELAVREARGALHFDGIEPSWASPVVFRTLGEEPTFSFLRSTPHCSVEEKYYQLRQPFWEAASHGARQPFVNQLINLENKILTEIEDNPRSGLVAERIIISDPIVSPPPGQGNLPVPITLVGAPSVSLLKGILQLANGEGETLALGDAQLINLRDSDALRGAGFRLFSDAPENNQITFRIESNAGEVLLPTDVLFTANIAISSTTGTFYRITFKEVQSDPQHSLCCVGNAVIVPSS